MSFPKQSEIELPLLKRCISSAEKRSRRSCIRNSPKCSRSSPKKIWLPECRAAPPSFAGTMSCSGAVTSSSKKARSTHRLAAFGNSQQGGRARATGASADSSEELLLAHQATLKDLVYENESEVKRRIISELQSLSATDFEQFCISFLGPLGYEQLQVTNRGADRGIDGHGLFRQGVVSIRSAFQAKRWRQNAVTRPEIDKFRCAIQGDYDHGVFLTTGRFTADAEAASIKKARFLCCCSTETRLPKA